MRSVKRATDEGSGAEVEVLREKQMKVQEEKVKC